MSAEPKQAPDGAVTKNGEPLALSVEELCVDYDGSPAIEGVTFSLLQGDFLGVIGPNGGGKTTLLKAVAGLVPVKSGSVHILGKPAQQMHPMIGYVSQHLLYDTRFPVTAMDVALMGRATPKHLFRRYTQEDRDAAEHALRNVRMQDHREERFASLSGGQQQRVLIARALAAQPRLLLLDEPTANIDTTVEEDIFASLAELTRELTVVMTTHDIGVISAHVNKIACLNKTLHYHGEAPLTPEVLQKTFECPVALIAHGVAHRVLDKH